MSIKPHRVKNHEADNFKDNKNYRDQLPGSTLPRLGRCLLSIKATFAYGWVCLYRYEFPAVA